MPATRRFHIEEPDLNMTPMIDIVFQLLIFFMVCSELASFDRVENLVLPVASAAVAEEQVPNRLIISVDTFSHIIIAGHRRTIEELGSYLRAEKKMRKTGTGRTSQPILIQADRNAQWRAVQDVMNEGTKFGFWKFSFSAMKEGE